MKTYALIVHPRTDGNVCDDDCPMLFNDIGHCAAFGAELAIVSSADHRNLRCAPCVEAERLADERAAK